jgi:hypothetical protein
MPLNRRDAPKVGRQAVQSALTHFAGVPDGALHALGGTTPAKLVPRAPHPVFNIGLSDLKANRALEASDPSGWRYLLHEGDKAVASAETVVLGGNEQFSHFNRGPFVASTESALKLAEGLPQLKDHEYEPRVFRAYPADELLQILSERASQIPEMGPDDTRGG